MTLPDTENPPPPDGVDTDTDNDAGFATAAADAEVPPFSSSAVPAMKNITSLIQITNDDDHPFAVALDNGNNNDGKGINNDGDDDGNDGTGDSPFDCLLIGTTTAASNTTSAIKGAIDEHLLPRVETTTRPFRRGIDEHVVARAREVATRSMESIDRARETSVRTLDGLKTETIRLARTLKESSETRAEEAGTHSRAFLDRSKQTWTDLSSFATGVVGETIEPGCREAWSSLVVTCAPYCAGTARGWKDVDGDFLGCERKAAVVLLSVATLRAFGRVVFCDNPFTGLWIVLGIACASPLAAASAVLAATTVNAVALYLGLDLETLRSGTYATNAVVMGSSVAGTFAFETTAPELAEVPMGLVFFWSLALAPFTLLLDYAWTRSSFGKIPSLLLPYNIVLLVAAGCAKVWNQAMVTQITILGPDIATIETTGSTPPTTFCFLETVFNGLSRIFRVGSDVRGFPATGVSVLVGVLFCSRILAASLLGGSLVSGVLLGYAVFGEDHSYLNAGWAGFNPALAVAGIFYYLVPSWKLTGLALFGVVAVVIAQGAVDVLLELVFGTFVSTSLGFFATLFPLLLCTGDPGNGNSGETYFLRAVPESDLSTPEDLLEKRSTTPLAEEPEDDPPTDSSSSYYNDDVGLVAADAEQGKGEEIRNQNDDAGVAAAATPPAANESTPLLPS